MRCVFLFPKQKQNYLNWVCIKGNSEKELQIIELQLKWKPFFITRVNLQKKHKRKNKREVGPVLAQTKHNAKSSLLQVDWIFSAVYRTLCRQEAWRSKPWGPGIALCPKPGFIHAHSFKSWLQMGTTEEIQRPWLPRRERRHDTNRWLWLGKKCIYYTTVRGDGKTRRLIAQVVAPAVDWIGNCHQTCLSLRG